MKTAKVDIPKQKICKEEALKLAKRLWKGKPSGQALRFIQADIEDHMTLLLSKICQSEAASKFELCGSSEEAEYTTCKTKVETEMKDLMEDMGHTDIRICIVISTNVAPPINGNVSDISVGYGV